MIIYKHGKYQNEKYTVFFDVKSDEMSIKCQIWPKTCPSIRGPVPLALDRRKVKSDPVMDLLPEHARLTTDDWRLDELSRSTDTANI